MESVLCVLLLPKCPWHKNKEEQDRRHDLLTVPQTCRALPRARCPYQSLKQPSPCSSPLLNCTLPPTDLAVCTMVMACLASFLLDNIRFLPDEPHETWHLSLTWNRLPAEAHHSHRQPCQAGFWVFLFCFFYPSGRRSGFLACVKSNQQGKAVITNKLLLVNLCQTMWSDQCVARNKDNIITVWQQSSGLCSSQGFCLAPHFSHVHSPDQTLEARQRHNDTPSQARTLLRSEVSLVLPPTRKIYVTLRKKAMCQRSNTGRCQSLINPQASNLFFLICRAFCYQLTTTDTDSRSWNQMLKKNKLAKLSDFSPPHIY